MVRIAISFLIILIILSMYCSKLYGQAVTGHISAEVVDLIYTVSDTNTNIELSTINKNDFQKLDQLNSNSIDFNLGSFILQSGSEYTYDVVLEPSSFSNLIISSKTIHTNEIEPSLVKEVQSDGSQTIQLNGKLNLSDDLKSENLHEFYSVVFAFN